jgi:hypothetical protein
VRRNVAARGGRAAVAMVRQGFGTQISGDALRWRPESNNVRCQCVSQTSTAQGYVPGRALCSFSVDAAKQRVAAKRRAQLPVPRPSIATPLSNTPCSRALSQKVAIYAKRLVGESDALAVEVGGGVAAARCGCDPAWWGGGCTRMSKTIKFLHGCAFEGRTNTAAQIASNGLWQLPNCFQPACAGAAHSSSRRPQVAPRGRPAGRLLARTSLVDLSACVCPPLTYCVQVKSLQASITALRRGAADRIADDSELEHVG